jgi:hypothetical protein
VSITADVKTMVGGTTLEVCSLISLVVGTIHWVKHRACASLMWKANLLRMLHLISHNGSRTKHPDKGVHMFFCLQLDMHLWACHSFHTSQSTFTMSSYLLHWVSFLVCAWYKPRCTADGFQSVVAQYREFLGTLLHASKWMQLSQQILTGPCILYRHNCFWLLGSSG